MSIINTDSKLLETLKNSSCFGIAYDDAAPECKLCDVLAQCKSKTTGGNVPLPKPKVQKPKEDIEITSEDNDKKSTPSSKQTTKTVSPSKPENKTTTKSVSKPSTPKSDTKPVPKVVNPNMPDWKEVTLDEMKAMAAKNNIDWKDYGNDNITRMRLIMSLKKLYE